MTDPITSLPEAVAAMGALPVPVGDEPHPLDDTRLAEIEADVAAYADHPAVGFWCCSAHPVADHVPALLAEVKHLRGQQALDDAEYEKATAEIQRLKGELAEAQENIAFLHRTTLPELRREVEHHKAGKQRWRDRAEKAEAAVERGLDILRVWRDERETSSEAARLLYEVGAALTDEPTAAKPAGMRHAVRTINPAEEA